jgi:hypothetical protein
MTIVPSTLAGRDERDTLDKVGRDEGIGVWEEGWGGNGALGGGPGINGGGGGGGSDVEAVGQVIPLFTDMRFLS